MAQATTLAMLDPKVAEFLAMPRRMLIDATLSFGGYKQSGWGREMGHHALELYTEVKSVVVGL
jgi:hypothetical protein